MMNNRIKDIPAVCEIIDILGKNDYRIGQSILNAIRQDNQDDGRDLEIKLYAIENDELLKLLKKFAAPYMPR